MRQQKPDRVLLVVAVLIGMVLTGCGRDTGSPQTPGITDAAVKIGISVPLSGPVSDAGTAQLLDEIGPIIGQGWHFGHPMPGPDLVAWIHARPDRT